MLGDDALPFRNEEEAYRYVENQVWPKGPVCPHCRTFGRINKMKGKSTRIGTYKCYACRKPFTVKVGTVFQGSHIPLHIWLKAIFLLSSTKKVIKINELRRVLEVSTRTAAFMAERIGVHIAQR